MTIVATTTGKVHWCGYCGLFVREKVEPRGYYGWARIVCPHCDHEIGTPEPHK